MWGGSRSLGWVGQHQYVVKVASQKLRRQELYAVNVSYASCEHKLSVARDTSG